MSQPWIPKSPHQARQSRSIALLGDMVSAASDAPETAPRWLISEQKQFVRSGGGMQLPPKTWKARPSDPSHAKKLPNENPDDDFIIVDLLDGAHVSTKPDQPPQPQHANMTSNSDSIISLPPIDARTAPQWTALKAEAQEARRYRQNRASVGSFASPSVLYSKQPSLLDVPQRRTKPAAEQFSGIENMLAPPDAVSTPPIAPPSHAERLSIPSGRRHRRQQSLTAALPESFEAAQYAAPPVRQQPPQLLQSPSSRPDGLDGAQNNAPSGRQRTRQLSSGNIRSEGVESSQKKSVPSGKQHLRPPPSAAARPEGIDFKTSQSRETLSTLNDGRKGHYRRKSFMTGSFWDEEFGNAFSVRSSERSKSQGRKRSRRLPEQFGSWGWRKPAEEDAVMPSGAWIYLALIGFCTFSIAFAINLSANFLSGTVISGIASVCGQTYGHRAGVLALSVLRGLSLAGSFLLVLNIAPYYSAGSGIPEMKCVLSGVLLKKMLNWKTLLSKSIGLIFSLSSEISIGRLGPFIHISGIIAALVSKIPLFESLGSSARFQLQALNAAMAAGVGATFGAPIGGTMLAIEIMSTYYYIHWLPMALYCSIMGYYFVVAFVQPEATAYFTTNVSLDLESESIQKLVTYVVLGALCGLVGAALVEFTKLAFLARRNYFKNNTPVITTAMVFVFAMFHSLVCALVGGVLAANQKDGVVQLFNESKGKNLWLTEMWKPFPYEHLNTSLTLAVATIVKFFLTGLSLVMPVPAGTFMPIFEIGALFGRAFGELLSGIWFVTWVDVRVTAIIGAAAVTAGTLHTTAVAVVMLELTREAIDVLPLAIGVIVAYGVSKHMCSDLFSELIKIRRLPFILGLRERYPSENKQFFDDAASVTAKSCMTKDFPFVTPESTKGEVYRMLTRGGKPWIMCAFLSDVDAKRLWGTVSQKALWDAIGDDFGQYVARAGEDCVYGTFDSEFSRENELIPFLKDFNPVVGHEHVDMGTMQISVHTPFWRVITYFRMLSMNTMYVVHDGETVGSVSRVQVIQYSIQLEERAKRKRAQENEIRARRESEEHRMLQQFRRNPMGGRMASRPSYGDMSSESFHGRKSRHGGSASRFR
eukprot:gb/GEZJ01001215.1/.p1 GENE.gb/GEZJ01001215.1/~~gb/GEZJ01001215.1/.p1  ORF type:complete len:1097 (-),score=149.60 gb/GEZJ01001215.1/:2925-6215(-)